MSLLDSLTPDDARQLVIAEDELATSRRYRCLHSFLVCIDREKKYLKGFSAI